MSASPSDVDPALLRPRPRIVYVEMDVDELARVLKRCHPMEVQMSGHGETTMLKHWTHVTRKLLDQGLPLTLTSNFAKRMSDDEIDVLSRFRALKISIDSTDATLLDELRRGVKLERLEDNL